MQLAELDVYANWTYIRQLLHSGWLLWPTRLFRPVSVLPAFLGCLSSSMSSVRAFFLSYVTVLILCCEMGDGGTDSDVPSLFLRVEDRHCRAEALHGQVSLSGIFSAREPDIYLVAAIAALNSLLLLSEGMLLVCSISSVNRTPLGSSGTRLWMKSVKWGGNSIPLFRTPCLSSTFRLLCPSTSTLTLWLCR